MCGSQAACTSAPILPCRRADRRCGHTEESATRKTHAPARQMLWEKANACAQQDRRYRACG
eukprot:4707612-Pleurochrysis_carterae.AAC.1